jgi:hypothetical protein
LRSAREQRGERLAGLPRVEGQVEDHVRRDRRVRGPADSSPPPRARAAP